MVDDYIKTLGKLVTKDNFQRARIGPVYFYINPTSAMFPDERNINMDMTAGGGIYRKYWGHKPRTMTLEGTMGMYKDEFLTALDKIRPYFGDEDTQWDYTFPFRFKGVRRVFVDNIVDRIEPEYPLSLAFTITVTEIPKLSTTYKQIITYHPPSVTPAVKPPRHSRNQMGVS